MEPLPICIITTYKLPTFNLIANNSDWMFTSGKKLLFMLGGQANKPYSNHGYVSSIGLYSSVTNGYFTDGHCNGVNEKFH